MELNTVLELIKAGFTKDEIMQMARPTAQNPNPVPVPSADGEPKQNPEPIPAPQDVPVPAPVPAPVPTPVPSPVQQPVQTPVQNETTLSDIMQGIAKLTSAVQANAIAQSVIPQGLKNTPTAEDMLAEIIKPTYRKEG